MNSFTTGTDNSANANAAFAFGRAYVHIEAFGGAYIHIQSGAPPAPPPPPPKPATQLVCAHRFLGVDCKATRAVITSAYRLLAKANHPDVGSPAERDARTRKMADYNRAYEEALGQL